MARKKKLAHKAPLSRNSILVIAFSTYILGLLVGCMIIWFIPFISHKSSLTHLAEERLENTLYSNSGYDQYTFGTEYYVFDTQNRLITSESVFSSREVQTTLRELLPELFEKGSVYKPAVFHLNNSFSQGSFGIIVGTTMKGKTGLRFAGFVLLDLKDLDISIKTFCVIYTLLHACSALLINSIHKQHIELDTMRKDFIANVGHELKTPITAIKALSEMIYDDIDKDPASRKKYSGGILQEADKLEILVNDILELSRLQSGRTPIHRETVLVSELVQPIIDRYTMLCMDSGITLDSTQLDLSLLPPVSTDANRMTTVFNIILDNAIKFTGSGGTITVTQHPRSNCVVFSIKDNGPGISEKDIPYIFTRFYKADVTHNSNGSGLGLSIADEIMRRLDEKIWVESVLSKGAEFSFTISYAAESAPKSPASHS